MLRVFGWTEAPLALGAHSALAWIGGLSPTTPLIGLPQGPSQSRAIAEFMVANKVAEGADYPEQAWWAEYAPKLARVYEPEWWAVNSHWGYTRDNAQGIQLAIGWAFGVIDNITVLTPAHAGDGSDIPQQRREEFARRLHTISTPSQPQAQRPGSAAVTPGHEPG